MRIQKIQAHTNDISKIQASLALFHPKYQAEYEAQKIPKIFSKTDDGCVVYSFVDEWRKHYFTRCEKMVVTDSEYTSGKTRIVESIQTH